MRAALPKALFLAFTGTPLISISGPHAIALKYVWSHRSASYQTGGDRRQTLGTVGIYYTLLGEELSNGTVDPGEMVDLVLNLAIGYPV